MADWIGIDLDGTLATYDDWTRWDVFGKPIPLMIERVKRWLAEGKEVRIFTARVAGTVERCLVTGEVVTVPMMIAAIHQWLAEQGLPPLRVTATKDHEMRELWDDRCVQVVPNTGRTLAEEHAAELSALAGKAYRPEAVREARDVDNWAPCAACTDPMDCGSWKTCHNQGRRVIEMPTIKIEWTRPR
jgi:hypothetical protein